MSERTAPGAIQDVATAMLLPVTVLYVAAETLADLGHPEWHAATDVVLDLFLALAVVGRWPSGARWVRLSVKVVFAIALAARLLRPGTP